MRAQLAVVVGLHSTAVCNHNQTTAPICSTNSSVPDAQDTERLSSTKKHIEDINLKKTASRKVVKNSYTNTDIVQAFTENGTPVETINTEADTIQHLLVILIQLVSCQETFYAGCSVLFFLGQTDKGGV